MIDASSRRASETVTAAVVDMHQAYIERFNRTSGAVAYMDVAGFTSKEIKRAGLRPALRRLLASGHAASGRSLRRSPATSSNDRHRTLREWCSAAKSGLLGPTTSWADARTASTRHSPCFLTPGVSCVRRLCARGWLVGTVT